jgi:hypothetical protein
MGNAPTTPAHVIAAPEGRRDHPRGDWRASM